MDPEWYKKLVEARIAARGPKSNVTPGQQRCRDRVARSRALLCVQGHELRPGPWGLQICDTCTAVAATQIRRTRQ